MTAPVRRSGSRPAPTPPVDDRRVARAGMVGTRRVKVLRAVLLLVAMVFAARLVQVQQVGADRFAAAGVNQRDGRAVLPADRGRILDRSGEALAVSVARPTVYVNPSAVTDEVSLANAVAPLLGLDAASLVNDIRSARERGGQFRYLGRQLDPAVAAAVMDLGFEAVGVIDEPYRLRPSGPDVAGSLLGGVDSDHVGVSGLELQFDEVLTGLPGEITFERGADGRIIPTGRTHIAEATPGGDLVLTIDRHLQWLTEDVLRDVVDRYQAQGAMAVVLRSDTAEVLAMANVVGVEDGPAEVAGYNMSVVDVFEPGSISKVFPISAVLDEGMTSADEVLSVPPSLTIYDADLGDEFAPGTRDMTTSEILQQSSNVGTVLLSERLGEELFDDYLRRFGFGSRTGAAGAAQFPGEASGQLLDVDAWSGVTLATVSYGQGIGVTALQMAAAVNVIANDGIYRTPTMVSGAYDDDGDLDNVTNIVERAVISPETAELMRSIMLGVTDGRGTGTRAAVPGYTVGGKTGTARKPDLENGGYLENSWMSTFAGFAPAHDPAVTVVVVIDDPQGDYYGGLVAAPVFQEIAEHAMRMLRVSPDAPLELQESADADG
ncbi:MAG: penicillin-binding protein 2 [Actinomycetota bacterium]